MRPLPRQLVALAAFDGWLLDDEHARIEVATQAGVVVGAGAALRTPMHPATALATIVVAPDHRGRGRGTALLDALRVQLDVPLKTRLPAAHPGVGFAGGRIVAVGLLHDGSEIAVCGGVDEPAADLAAPVMRALLEAAAADHVEVEVDVDQGADDALWDVLTALPHRFGADSVVVLVERP